MHPTKLSELNEERETDGPGSRKTRWEEEGVGTSENGRGTGEEVNRGEYDKIYNVGKCNKENYFTA